MPILPYLRPTTSARPRSWNRLPDKYASTEEIHAPHSTRPFTDRRAAPGQRAQFSGELGPGQTAGVGDLDEGRRPRRATYQAGFRRGGARRARVARSRLDEGPVFQSDDLAPYEEALAALGDRGEVYPCRCTRKQIELASLSAPHGDAHELRYPGTCRPSEPTPLKAKLLVNEEVAWRIRVPEGETMFVDQFAGEQRFDIAATVGDFLIGAKGGMPGYQLAVVVDDARQGIDRVVRGDDLLSSTPRQLLMYDRLQLGPPPKYTHLPMVVGEDGRRLAKRHGDSRLSYYRSQGTPAARIVGLLAEWCGCGTRREMTTGEFLSSFNLERMPLKQITFSSNDNRWLLER